MAARIAAPPSPLVVNASASSYMAPLCQLLLSWPDDSLLTLLKAAMSAAMLPAGAHNPNHSPMRISLAVAAAVEQRLSDAAAAASNERQLEALQAGMPDKRRLALSELRQHCLLAHVRAAMELSHHKEGEAASPGQMTSHLSVLFALPLSTRMLGPASPQETRSLTLASATELLRRCPSHPRPAVLLADLHLSFGDLDAAVQHLRTAVQRAQAADRSFWLARAGHPLASLEAMCSVACLSTYSLQEAELLKQQASSVGL